LLRVISLTLDGSFSTTVNFNSFNKPFAQGTTVINSDGTLSLTIGLSGESNIDSINMSVTPSSGSDSIIINSWATSSDYYKKWTEKGSISSLNVSRIIGDLKPNEKYSVKINGILFNNYIADGSGQISFNSTIDSNQNTFEVQLVQTNSNTNLVSSLNPSTVGQGVTFTAGVSAVAPATGTPTGSVTFKDGGTTLSTVILAGGQASYSTAALNSGSHTISAVYSGDSTFSSSTGSLMQTVTGSASLTVYESNTTANDIDNIGNSLLKAQSFTPTVSHAITRISLELMKMGSPSGNVVVHLRNTDSNGLPTGADLATGQIPCSAVTSGSANWYDFDLGISVTLNAGTRYAICMEASGSDRGSNGIWCYISTNNPYSSGWITESYDTGTNWKDVVSRTFDAAFKEWGR